jgi:hypothetical protein
MFALVPRQSLATTMSKLSLSSSSMIAVDDKLSLIRMLSTNKNTQYLRFHMVALEAVHDMVNSQAILASPADTA